MYLEPELEVYFFQTRNLWREYISQNFPLNLKMLQENEAHLDWYLVSQNKAIPWSAEIIQNFEAHWEWMKLTRNGALYRKVHNIESLIKHYADLWSWKHLQKKEKVSIDARVARN